MGLMEGNENGVQAIRGRDAVGGAMKLKTPYAATRGTRAY